jgi:non-ribosomal peptide synthetase component F
VEQLLHLRNGASQPDAAQNLSSLLSSHSGPWPIRHLILTFQDIYKSLPESLKANNNESVARLRTQVKAATPCISDVIGTDSRAGFIDATTERHLSHIAIRQFVQNFQLPVGPSGHGKPRIAVILPNGPLLAIAVLAFANRYTIVPMASNTVPEQLHVDIEQVQADAVVALDADIGKLQLDNGSRPVFGIEHLEDLTFRVVSAQHASAAVNTAPNTGDDIAIILFTSGTSGNKKLVPITSFNLIAGTMATIESVELSETDTCLNMMPLNHVYVSRQGT